MTITYTQVAAITCYPTSSRRKAPKWVVWECCGTATFGITGKEFTPECS